MNTVAMPLHQAKNNAIQNERMALPSLFLHHPMVCAASLRSLLRHRMTSRLPKFQPITRPCSCSCLGSPLYAALQHKLAVTAPLP
ncbi:hypothetical protein MPLB_610001 [Mesorhizobium sp. ORS 3324]|nr:hypothetical protein MPLB_610001 [Mesorhizobium sp. ORS 3324]